MFARRVAQAVCVAAVLVACAVVSAAGEEVGSYNISVTLDPRTHTLTGAEWVEYVNDTGHPVGEVVFLLVANWGRERNPHIAPSVLDAGFVAGFDPTWTMIREVSDASKAPLAYRLEPSPPSLQTYSLDDVLLVVELAKVLPPGGRVTLHIGFQTKFAAALGADMCVYRDTYIWRFGWNPIAIPRDGDDQAFALPAAMYRVELTIPDGYQAFGGADEQVSTMTPDGWTTITLSNERAVRSVPLFVGRDLDVVSTTWNGIPIDVVALPGGERFAQLAAFRVPEILGAYNERFGALASGRLVIVEDPTPGLYGLAADGMVLVGSLASRMKDMPVQGMYDRLLDYLLAHEVAHLWWGIGVGADFNAENWLSEGFAEYLSIRYFEARYGAFEPNLFAGLGAGLVEDLVSEVLGYYNLRQHMVEIPYLALLKMGFDEGIVKPLSDMEYLNGATVRTYKKGYLVLRALEGVLGTDGIEALLREVAAAWSGRTLTVATFREIVERTAGNALYPQFFEDWVIGDAQLDLAVEGFECVVDGDEYTTTVRVRRSGPPLPVAIAATLSNGSVVRATWISSDGAAAAVPFFITRLPVVRIHIDPEEMLPDRNRFNNHWPRKVLVDGLWRAPDAPAVGRPLDAYLISLSAFTVSGLFRNDHEWSVTAFPHIDATVDTSTVDWREFFRRWDVYGAFAADIDRRLSLRSMASVVGLDLAEGAGDFDLRLSAILSFYSHPETGSPGRYWYPTCKLDVTFGAVGSLAEPVPYASFTVSTSALPRHERGGSVALILGIPGLGDAPFAACEARGMVRLRAAAFLYFDLSASISEGLIRPLPAPFEFSLDALHGFANLPTGQRQASAGVDVVLPPAVRDWGYSLLNLARIDSVTPVLFLRGGRTWLEAPPVFDLGFRLETGGELRWTLVGPLGLEVHMTLGYAYPLIGPDARDQLYVGLALGL
ncbi:MAG: M1 family aminopeptidase [Candidatus Bipolaricaulis sp.]|nr:M1 family aminopeptidase [Candidatus Bipolaricaulis sp.]